MGFSNVNDYPPSDSLLLSQDDLKEKPINLKYVKFQNVRSLTIFIEDNQGGNDISKVQKIALYETTKGSSQFLQKLREMGNCLKHHCTKPADFREVRMRITKKKPENILERQVTVSSEVVMSYEYEDLDMNLYDGKWHPTLQGIPELLEW